MSPVPWIGGVAAPAGPVVDRLRGLLRGLLCIPAIQRCDLVGSAAPDVPLGKARSRRSVPLRGQHAADVVRHVHAGLRAGAGRALPDAGQGCKAVEAVLPALVRSVVTRGRVVRAVARRSLECGARHPAAHCGNLAIQRRLPLRQAELVARVLHDIGRSDRLTDLGLVLRQATLAGFPVRRVVLARQVELAALFADARIGGVRLSLRCIACGSLTQP